MKLLVVRSTQSTYSKVSVRSTQSTYSKVSVGWRKSMCGMKSK